ncbi:MAG: Glutaredoxin, partial [Paramarteilia canceri]
ATNLLQKENIQYDEIILDKKFDSATMSSFQDQLEKQNGFRTVPQVYLAGKHVVDSSQLQTMKNNGSLKKILEEE